MGMNVEINHSFNNRLLNRYELNVSVSHPGKSFVKEMLNDFIVKNYKSKHYVISKSKTQFGKTVTNTEIKIYDDLETMKEIEDFHVLLKKGLVQKTKDARRIRKDKRKRK